MNSLKNSSSTFKIPMHGDVDSLNLSVSTAIILYEAMNQRKILILCKNEYFN